MGEAGMRWIPFEFGGINLDSTLVEMKETVLAWSKLWEVCRLERSIMVAPMWVAFMGLESLLEGKRTLPWLLFFMPACYVFSKEVVGCLVDS
ncbi:hypothetical protein ACFX19_020124 [Malus domestica]